MLQLFSHLPVNSPSLEQNFFPVAIHSDGSKFKGSRHVRNGSFEARCSSDDSGNEAIDPLNLDKHPGLKHRTPGT